MNIQPISTTMDFADNNYNHFYPSDTKVESEIQIDIDYCGAYKRKKYNEERELQNQITQYQKTYQSFEKTSDIVHYLKDLKKGDKENLLPEFSELFKEVRNVINEASKELESGNIPVQLGEIISEVVEQYMGDLPENMEPNENNILPVNEMIDNTSIGEGEMDSNTSNIPENSFIDGNNLLIEDSLIKSEENNNSIEDDKENNEFLNNNNVQTEIDDLYNGLKEKMEEEIIHPIHDLLQVVKERETKLADQLLDVQREDMRHKRILNHQEMMKELKIELLKKSNHFMIYQFILEQRRMLVNLLM